MLNYNSGAGTDASPSYAGTAIAFGGSAGANELRFSSTTYASAAATTTTASANWPYVTRQASTFFVDQLWAFSSDAVGLLVTTYTSASAGVIANTHYNQLRWNWDALGTFAAAPQFGAFSDSTHTTPSPGTQPGAQSGSPIVNGQVTDTSSTSYLKANAYGYGVDAAGAQQTPAAAPTNAALVTSGTAGALSPATGAWLTNFQSLQGFTQYILDGVVPKALTAGFWYFLLALFSGPNQSTGTLLPVVTLQYSYS